MTSAVSTTARASGRVLHQLWLEVTGVVFLIMSVSGAAAWAHEFAKYRAGQRVLGRVLAASCFTLTFAWFGVSSFWKVRQKGRGRAR
jgi:hypothetical protein